MRAPKERHSKVSLARIERYSEAPAAARMDHVLARAPASESDFGRADNRT
jgi:hypothetical protein